MFVHHTAAILIASRSGAREGGEGCWRDIVKFQCFTAELVAAR
jgi:hypothetical protein